MRGDNARASRSTGFSIGSPPHAWGQFEFVEVEAPSARFTPTCVGTMISSSSGSSSSAVHPHMRGDNKLSRAASRSITVHPHMRGDNSTIIQRRAGVSGSPPHAWGQYGRLGGLARVHRFTPTCVGTMRCPVWASSPSAVHPHMRGDNRPTI